MSANTSIQEGSLPRAFGPVDALMVLSDGGVYMPWYPETDRALATLNVEENGIYQASAFGVYGWSSVQVDVPMTDHVTGKDPNTGNDVGVRVNPETGELERTVLPAEIRVTTQPLKLVYRDGERIDMSGGVVTAYDANSEEMQVVPLGQLVLDPNRAAYDESVEEQTITVSWARPVDEAVLETSFEIMVTGG